MLIEIHLGRERELAAQGDAATKRRSDEGFKETKTNRLPVFENDRARLRLTPRHYAYLRISEGCNQNCAFCTIPSIRGKMRSKPLDRIVGEARELVLDGAFELNLIGQDTTSFGTDVGYIDVADPRREFELMAAAGLDWRAILASLTTQPAQRFGFADDKGRVAAGMDADLVVLLIEASPQGYREHGSFEIPKVRPPSWSHPVISNGILFELATDGPGFHADEPMETMGERLAAEYPEALVASLRAPHPASLGVGFTVHAAIGAEITHQHPAADGAAIGATS